MSIISFELMILMISLPFKLINSCAILAIDYSLGAGNLGPRHPLITLGDFSIKKINN
jgi:hypothetical protein